MFLLKVDQKASQACQESMFIRKCGPRRKRSQNQYLCLRMMMLTETTDNKIAFSPPSEGKLCQFKLTSIGRTHTLELCIWCCCVLLTGDYWSCNAMQWCVIQMIPMKVVIWMYLWRHLDGSWYNHCYGKGQHFGVPLSQAFEYNALTMPMLLKLKQSAAHADSEWGTFGHPSIKQFNWVCFSYNSETLSSGTKTEFCVPDHGSQTAIMAKFRAFMRNPDLFRTTFLTFSRDVHLNYKKKW